MPAPDGTSYRPRSVEKRADHRIAIGSTLKLLIWSVVQDPSPPSGLDASIEEPELAPVGARRSGIKSSEAM